jgi:hypothetical protein
VIEDRFAGLLVLALGLLFIIAYNATARGASEPSCPDCRREVERLTVENKALRAVCKKWPGDK